MSRARMPACYEDVISFIGRALQLAQEMDREELRMMLDEFRTSVCRMKALQSAHVRSPAKVSQNYRLLTEILSNYADMGDLMEAELAPRGGADFESAMRAADSSRSSG